MSTPFSSPSPAPSGPQPASAGPAALDGATDPQDMTRPLYGAKFGAAARRFLRGATRFSGRASRSEYWWSVLLQLLLMLIPTILFWIGFIACVSWNTEHAQHNYLPSDDGGTVDYPTYPGIQHAPLFPLLIIGMVLTVLVCLALLLPSIAITWRRLHDANMSGLLALLALVPSIGGLIVLVLTLLPSKPEGRRFDTGASPVRTA